MDEDKRLVEVSSLEGLDVGKSSVALVGKRRRQWHPTPVLLPGESHGQRSLVGYSPQGRKESDWIQTTIYKINKFIF